MIKAEFLDRELIEHLSAIEKDGMSVFLMADGLLRAVVFNGTEFVNRMRVQHNLGILETMILGQACLCSALMIPLMKGKEHLVWKYNAIGIAEGFSVEADSSGYVRGYIFNNSISLEKPVESWDLKPFLVGGSMSFTRVKEGFKEPAISFVDSLSGNIAEDLALYFKQSEQIATAFNTGIQLDKQGRVVGAGGILLQSMPDIGGHRNKGNSDLSENIFLQNENLLQKAENAFRAAPSIGTWFSEKGTIEDIVYGLFREFSPAAAVNRSVVFDCPCSKNHFASYINILPREKISELKDEGKTCVEVACKNCGSVYEIPVNL